MTKNNDDEKYIYILNQKTFEKFLKQKNDRIYEQLLISKKVTFKLLKFVNNEIQQFAKKIFD